MAHKDLTIFPTGTTPKTEYHGFNFAVSEATEEDIARAHLPDMDGLTSEEYFHPTTQIHKILCYLEDHIHEGMSSLEAIHRYGATRLAAQVSKLKDKGVIIESVDEYGLNRYDDHVRYARYYFRGYTNGPGKRPRMN